MKNIKVSVIIPTYNAQDFIKQSVISVLSQTLTDIEVIIVNDGSTDNTAEIIQKISKEDSRLKIINQENQSVGIARSNGVLYATGEYIAFVDSDDTLDATMLQNLYENAKENGSDIVVCAYNNVDSDGKVLRKSSFFKSDNSFDSILLLKTNPATWNKIYRRELFVQNNIKFTPNIFCEDLATTPKLFYFAKKITYVDLPLYNYFINPKGASQIIKKKNIDDIFTALEVNKNFLLDNDIFDKYELIFHKRFFLKIQYINKRIHCIESFDEKNELLQFFYNKVSSNQLYKINKKFCEQTFSTSKHLYFKLLAYEIHRLGINSIFIYGYSDIFYEVEEVLNCFGITIKGVIESQHNQRCINYAYGTLDDFKNCLHNSAIFIVSWNNFDAIKININNFMQQHRIDIKVI